VPIHLWMYGFTNIGIVAKKKEIVLRKVANYDVEL
jgi:hypothetical protein